MIGPHSHQFWMNKNAVSGTCHKESESLPVSLRHGASHLLDEPFNCLCGASPPLHCAPVRFGYSNFDEIANGRTVNAHEVSVGQHYAIVWGKGNVGKRLGCVLVVDNTHPENDRTPVFSDHNGVCVKGHIRFSWQIKAA